MPSLIILLVLTILFWIVIILPQQRKVRAHASFVEQLAVGDEVVTTAGVYGTVTALQDDTVGLEIAAGTEITIARLAVGRMQAPPSPENSEEELSEEELPEGPMPGLGAEAAGSDHASEPATDPYE